MSRHQLNARQKKKNNTKKESKQLYKHIYKQNEEGERDKMW